MTQCLERQWGGHKTAREMGEIYTTFEVCGSSTNPKVSYGGTKKRKISELPDAVQRRINSKKAPRREKGGKVEIY